MHQDARNGLGRAAASAWVDRGPEAVELLQERAPWRVFMEKYGLISKKVVVDARQGPWDSYDATTIRAVPLKCVSGRPDCAPILESEKTILPDCDSGTLHIARGEF